MDSLEKISVDRLFRVSKAITLAGRPLVVRALSDWELKEQHEEAVLASLTTQRALADPTSRQYQIRLAGVIERATDDELRSLIRFAVQQIAAIEAGRELQPEYVPLAENATDEERRDWVVARQASWDKAKALREAYVAKRVSEQEEKAKGQDREQLIAQFKQRAIMIQVDNDFAYHYDTVGLAYAVRQTDGSAYFESIAEAGQCDDVVRQILLREMRAVNDLSPLALSGTSSTAAALGPGLLPEQLAMVSGLATASEPPGGSLA